MLEIASLMTGLSKVRPAYHSEADFQHALAWEIHQSNPNSQVRLEYKPPFLDGRAYVDIWSGIGSHQYAIELKYKTRGLRFDIHGEVFELLNQSAQDIGRYDFLWDICRLEMITSHSANVVGYAVLLTNDPSYWTEARDNGTVDAAFRLHEGRILKGQFGWGPAASEGTKRDREDPISLKGTYKLQWKDYSEPIGAQYGKFRFLAVTVGD